MKTLIVYATGSGTAEKCASMLKDKLGGADVYNLKAIPKLNLADYDTIVIGGSIHAGRIQGRVRKFCSSNLDMLKTKKVGIFICCMEEGENAEKQLNNSYPEELLKHAVARGTLGGEFDFEKMSGLQKFIIKKMGKTTESVFKLSEENIDKFARQLQ